MITITPFTQDCIPDIIKLSRACFRRTLSRRTVRQRFTNAIGYLAYDNGRPVAYYGVFDQPHQGYRSAQSGWTMTHPKYRGRGLFRQLAERTYRECARRGYDFVFGFPNQKSYPGFCHLGWQWYGYMITPTITGLLPLTELLHRFTLTRWIISKRERTYRGIPYRVDGHIYVGRNTGRYEDYRSMVRRWCAGKLILTLHVHDRLEPFNNNLPVGIYKINKNLTEKDYEQLHFTRQDFDTYFS